MKAKIFAPFFSYGGRNKAVILLGVLNRRYSRLFFQTAMKAGIKYGGIFSAEFFLADFFTTLISP